MVPQDAADFAGKDDGLRRRVPATGCHAEDHLSAWERFKRWARVERTEPLPSFLGAVEDPRPGTYAVCCSGGGVRSAAFNLGALQVLARTRYLKRARYVAAVSGGSYIAAAMAMVFKQGPDGSNAGLLARQGPFAPGSPEEQYLRNRSNYMAPGPGGKVRLALRVLIGLLVNLVLIGTFLVVVGALLALLYRALFAGLVTGSASGRDCTSGAGCDFDAGIAAGHWVPAAVLAGLGLLASFISVMARFRERRRERWETWGVRLLGAALILAVVLVALPVLVEVARDLDGAANEVTTEGKPPADVLGTVGFTGIAGVLLTALLQLRTRVSEPARVLQAMGRTQRLWRSLGAALRTALAYLVAAIAGPLLLALFLIAVVSSSLSPVGDAYWPVVIVCAAVCTAISVFGDVTSWSLHPFYRRRLCTAFALKRVADDTSRIGRAVERDFDSHPPLSAAHADGWPTLLVCAAANVSDPGATPPGRGVTSFTFSARTIGGPLIGSMAMGEYETRTRPRRHDLTLPAVVAMSGAALSPSMGKLTRWPLRFVLGLANVRLGVWLPNPRHVASANIKVRGTRDATQRLRYPKPGARYLVRELFGRNHVGSRYIYVTDGGHYENLGLVEVLRRGCTNVFCFDASGGESFANLGDAVALARSELQVEIEIDPSPLLPKPDRNLADTDTVVGSIRYPGGECGTLVYSRTVMTADAPWDVHAYHEADGKFPHNPTADQLYTDQKFEAYRALGMTAARRAVALLENEAPAVTNGRSATVSRAARTPVA